MEKSQMSTLKYTLRYLFAAIASLVVVGVFVLVTKQMIYDMGDTAVKILMSVPIVICSIISVLYYMLGSSAVSRELSAFFLIAGFGASFLLFKSYYPNSDNFYYDYGILIYILLFAAFAMIIMFDSIVPLVFYSVLIVEFCKSMFTSEYTVLALPATIALLVPVIIYAVVRWNCNDYRRYLSKLVPVAALAFYFFASSDAVILVIFAAIFLIAAILVVLLKKNDIEKAYFKSQYPKNILVVIGIAVVLGVTISYQVYCCNNINSIRYQNGYAYFEVERLEIEESRIAVYIKNKDSVKYSDETYALIKPKSGSEEYFVDRYSDSSNDREALFLLAKYLNGEAIISSCNTSILKGETTPDGFYDSDDWDIAYVWVYIDDTGIPSVNFPDSFEVSGNGILENAISAVKDNY